MVPDVVFYYYLVSLKLILKEIDISGLNHCEILCLVAVPFRTTFKSRLKVASF